MNDVVETIFLFTIHHLIAKEEGGTFSPIANRIVPVINNYMHCIQTKD
ncbi:hypothetical protein [Shimazuella kribbensis]